MSTYTPGLYQAEILDHGFEESTVKGTPCFSILFRVRGRYDDQHQLQECPHYERSYKQYLANETGLSILKGDLKTIGVQISDLTQLERGTSHSVKLVGLQIDVQCELEPYDGRMQERWRIPRSRKKLDLSAVRLLNDRFGHLLRGGSGSPPPPPPPVARNDDDQPF